MQVHKTYYHYYKVNNSDNASWLIFISSPAVGKMGEDFFGFYSHFLRRITHLKVA